jgi:hypothetical protein
LRALDPVIGSRPVEHAALLAFVPPPGLRLARFRELG